MESMMRPAAPATCLQRLLLLILVDESSHTHTHKHKHVYRHTHVHTADGRYRKFAEITVKLRKELVPLR